MAVLWACTDYVPSSEASFRGMYPSLYTSSLTHMLVILQRDFKMLGPTIKKVLKFVFLKIFLC
jgi:hypothetical protein